MKPKSRCSLSVMCFWRSLCIKRKKKRSCKHCTLFPQSIYNRSTSLRFLNGLYKMSLPAMSLGFVGLKVTSIEKISAVNWLNEFAWNGVSFPRLTPSYGKFQTWPKALLTNSQSTQLRGIIRVKYIRNHDFMDVYRWSLTQCS